MDKRYKDYTVEEKKEYQRLWYIRNKEKKAKQSKDWYIKNKEKHNLNSKKNYNDKKDEYRARRRRNNAKRRTQPKYKLINSLRSGVYCALKFNKKYKKTIDLLGCSIDEFKTYLESKFIDGMTWDNYGKLWHIDHIVPVSSFDFSNYNDQMVCFHYTNMRPLLAEENMRKRDKILEPTQMTIPL